MSVQMSFVFVKFTGHVMAVLTQTSGVDLQAADVATPALVVRGFWDDTNKVNEDSVFKITPDWLDVFTGGVIDAALTAPRTYVVDKAKKSVTALGSSGLKLTAGTQNVHVDLPSPAGGTTNVFIACTTTDPDKPEILQPQISGAGTGFDFPVGPLPSGAYVLALVAGYLPVVNKVP
jgi:hypothetical protein